METINGEKYSRESFDGYRYRARIKLVVSEVKDHQVVKQELSTDIYTTESDNTVVQSLLFRRSAESVTELTVIGWTSRAEDDATTKFLEELLDEEEA